MNGPSGNRDLGNLFPAVDNDDGSAYYEMSSNAVAYGGFKNFLGNDKIWRENLILYPNGRTVSSGNGPCIMAWAVRMSSTQTIRASRAVRRGLALIHTLGEPRVRAATLRTRRCGRYCCIWRTIRTSTRRLHLAARVEEI